MGGGSSLNPFGGNFSPSDAFRSTRNTLFGSPQQSRPQVFPGYFQGEEARAFAEEIRNVANQILNVPAAIGTGPAMSRFRPAYESSVLDRFTPTTAETDLLNTVSDRTAAQFASRGLGATPIAASATAASIAPTLVELRQRQIENLRQGLAGDVSEQASGRDAAIAQRGQTIQSLLAQYGTRLQALLNLFESAAIPRGLGQETRGGTNPIFSPINIAELIKAGAGGGSGGAIS